MVSPVATPMYAVCAQVDLLCWDCGRRVVACSRGLMGVRVGGTLPKLLPLLLVEPAALPSLTDSLAWITSHNFRKITATILDEAEQSARQVADQLGP